MRVFVLVNLLLALATLAVADQLPFGLNTLLDRPKFSPLRPPAIPLAVRSPYLSTWVSTHNKETLNGQWPIFWTGAEVGWSGLLQVDNVNYEWLGYPSSSLPNVESVVTELVEYTATKTVYTLSAGKVGVNVTFLTPITLDDLRRQSLPVSYLSLSFWSLDKKNHSVSLYSDVDGRWLSGDSNSRLQWSIGLNSKKTPDGRNVISHIVEKETHGRFSEWYDKAEWGHLYWSTSMVIYSSALLIFRMRDSHIEQAFQTMSALNSSRADVFPIQSTPTIDPSTSALQSLAFLITSVMFQNMTYLKSIPKNFHVSN